MIDLQSDQYSPRQLLDVAVANVAAYPRWSIERLQALAPATICVTEDGYFINYSVDEPSQSDGILVKGASMWITGDMWKATVFGSRMDLPALVADSGRRWLRCDARFGLRKIGDEADPVAALKAACTWGPLRQVRPGRKPGDFLLIGDSTSVELVNDPRAGLIIRKISEDGADLMALHLDRTCVLPQPAPEDTLERDDVLASKPRTELTGARRKLNIELHRDADASNPDFPWVVTSYEIIGAVGLSTAHDIEQLVESQGLLAGLASDVVFDSAGDQLIAFCRTRKSASRLVAALRLLA